MNLVWKLLRQHISIPQFAGFAFANLFGMLIVLFGFQFYQDVLPVFTQQDSFMKADYLIMSKKIGMGNTISGRTNTFSGREIDDVSSQKFVKKVGKFTSTEYKVDASMGVNGVNVLNSELFFESVPDGFVDVPLKDWKYEPGSKEVPIILPRTYINMYNFGFAQSHSLPKISDGLVGMIDFEIFIQAGGKKEQFKGKVIGFSSRLNTILVPQAFMDWSNHEFAPEDHSDPTRLIVEVGNPADENISQYLDENGYEVETDKLDAEKTTYFLRMMVTMVMVAVAVTILNISNPTPPPAEVIPKGDTLDSYPSVAKFYIQYNGVDVKDGEVFTINYNGARMSMSAPEEPKSEYVENYHSRLTLNPIHIGNNKEGVTNKYNINVSLEGNHGDPNSLIQAYYRFFLDKEKGANLSESESGNLYKSVSLPSQESNFMILDIDKKNKYDNTNNLNLNFVFENPIEIYGRMTNNFLIKVN